MNMFRIAAWFVLITPSYVLAAQDVLPSPSDLIAKAQAANDAQEARGNKYTFREDHTERTLDKKGKPGKLSTETYDHIMLEGSEYQKLVLVDGKPLDAKTQKHVDDEMEKERLRRKKGGVFSHSVSLGGLKVLGKLYDNRVTGEETIGGRKAWRMESEPKPGIQPENNDEEQALCSRLVVWFDEEDGAEIRQTNEFLRATNNFEPGSVTDITMTKLGDDWVRGDFYMWVDVKLLPRVHARIDSHQHFYNYKRFTVETSFTPQ